MKKIIKNNIVIKVILVIFLLLEIAVQIVIDRNLFLSVYNFKVQLMVEMALLISILVTKSDKLMINRYIVTITIMIICMVAYLMFMPLYSVGEARKQLESKFSKITPIKVNSSYKTISIDGNKNVLIKSAYVFSTNSNDLEKQLIVFNPENGSYKFIKK